jgi:UPF0755 protein
MNRKRARAWAVTGSAIALLLLGAWIAAFLWRPLDFVGGPRELHIEPGSSLRTVSRELHAAGMLPDAWRFEALGRVLGRDGAVRAGSYRVEPGWSALRVLDALTGAAAARLDRIALLEGWSFRQMRAALDAHPSLRHETSGLSEHALLERLEIAASSPEGLFFPDTYYFPKGASDALVLRRAAQRMQTVLAEQWSQRQADLPLSDPYQALILASIVEKETGRETDRPLVAAVLLNRLRKGMRLQTDPTVIYGLGERFDGDLRRRDLESDTPYNTYTRPGLPPTPIAMPGLASISAALNPAASPALYFVGRGDGSSHFSESLSEHNRAVNKYQRQPAASR